MGTPLRVLIVEDCEDDALLILDELREGGYDPVSQRVETREQMEAALNSLAWDIIIADYRLPDFDGLEALELAAPKCDHCPFVIVSGQIDEETAVSAMRAGANDYILKGNLARLVPAVERELKEAELRRQRNEVEEALRRSEVRYRTLFDSIDEGFCIIQIIFDDGGKPVDYRFLETNPAFERLTGHVNAQGKSIRELAPDHEERWVEIYGKIALTGKPARFQNRAQQIDRWYNVYAFRFGEPEKMQVAILLSDITDSKAAEEALQNARWRAEALENVAAAGIATTDVQELLDTLVSRMADTLCAHSCSIWMLDDDAGEFVAKAACGIPGMVGTCLKTDEGVAGAIYRERKPVCVADAEHDPLVTETILKDQKVKALISVPLINRNRLVGMARVDMLDPRVFSDREIGLLEAMASRAAQAIDNTKLYEALTKSRNELEGALQREKHYSLLLQRALLPGEPNAGPGYDVASEYVAAYQGREIGGDFYDVFRVNNRWAGVLIGDVAGKGLEAAAMAATTRSTIHAYVHETPSAGKALELANSVLSGQPGTDVPFVTVFLAIIDLVSGEMNYSSAGHPPAMICRRYGGVELLEGMQLPLAVQDDQRFDEQRTVLHIGDKLIFYTDGISEARHDGQLFDLEGIKRTLLHCAQSTSHELARAILSAATDWAEGKLKDDAAVVVVERLE